MTFKCLELLRGGLYVKECSVAEHISSNYSFFTFVTAYWTILKNDPSSGPWMGVISVVPFPWLQNLHVGGGKKSPATMKMPPV